MKRDFLKYSFKHLAISLLAGLALSLSLYQFESISVLWAIFIGFGASILSYSSIRNHKRDFLRKKIKHN